MGSGSSFGGGIEALLALVAERIERRPRRADPLLLDQLGALVAEAHSLAVLGLRHDASARVTGAKPGPEASVRKLLGVEHDQRTQELGLELLGPEGATTVGAAAAVDVRLPRQPLPHHRRRHERDPAQRHRRAPPRPAPRPRTASRLMAHLLTDQLRLMAEALRRRGRLHRRRHRTSTSRSREWEAGRTSWPAGSSARAWRKGDRVAHPRAAGGGRARSSSATRPSTRRARWPCPRAPASSPASSATCSATPARWSPSAARRPRRCWPRRGPTCPSCGAVVTHRAAVDDVELDRVGRRHRSGRLAPSRCRVDGDDMADLMYTSGTTGRPEGRGRPPPQRGHGARTALPAVVGHGLAARVADVHVRRHRVHLQPDEARACGCSTCPASTSTAGSTSSSSAGPAATFLVPAMAELLIASPRFDDADLSSITICPLGSAPVSPATLAAAAGASCPTRWCRTRGA